METFHALYGGRGDADEATNVGLKGTAGKAKETAPRDRRKSNNCSNSKSNGNGGKGRGSGSGQKEAFVVPQPSRYVPDWAAFGSGERKKHGSSKNRASSARQGENGEVRYDTVTGANRTRNHRSISSPINAVNVVLTKHHTKTSSK